MLFIVAAVLELCDHAEGPHSRGGGAPVCVVVVLATFQKVLVAVVVRLIIEDPSTINHRAGVELPELQGLKNRRAIFTTFCHLTSEVLLVVESDLPGLSVYLKRVTLEKCLISIFPRFI